MLSIQPIKSAQGAADYYAAAFNYYAGDAQALRWLGRGAERLGLQGVVEKEQLLSLLQGRLPDGQVLQNKRGTHRPGFDMTFSAPKSVSILIGLQADSNLETLHDLAVEKAITRIEKEFAQARIVIDGKVHYVNTGNLVVAAFRQPSSRANDPATHTHAVTMNMTFTDEEGKARSLASDIHGHQGVIEQLQRQVTYGGLIYRTELANLLKTNGYTLEDLGKGMFEIAGFSKEILREFSTRRVDIEERMQEEGWEGARLASKATLLTRDAKEEHNIEVLRTDWKNRANRLGFDAKGFVQAHKDKHNPSHTMGWFSSFKEKLLERFYGKEDLSILQAKEAVFVAQEMLSQQTSVFELRQLKEVALKHTLTGRAIVPIERMEAIIEGNVKQGLLYQAHDPMTGKSVLTTPWALTMETETLARIEANQGILKPLANHHAVLNAQKNHEDNASFPLTASQKTALMHVFTSTDRFNAIQGYAGTGKTTLLNLTQTLANAKGFEIRGMAVTSSAVNELRDKAGIRSDVFPIIQKELQKAPNQSLQNILYILDEASMLSTTQGHELIKLIEQKGARLLLTGDDDQLSSVKCGRIFGQAQDYGIQTTHMTDIIRQTKATAKEAVLNVIHRDLHDSLQKLDEVITFEAHEDRIDAMAQHWLNLSPSVRDRTLIFAPTHKNRHAITEQLREGLKKEGTLVGQEHVLKILKPQPIEEIQYHHTQYYQQGTVLRFNLRLPRSGIRPGDYLTVGSMTDKHKKNKTVPLVTNEGKSVVFHLKDLPPYQTTRAGLNRPIEFYEQSELALCRDDRVLITRNHNPSGLVNASLAVVIAIDQKSLTLKIENDEEAKTFSRDAAELQHLDHGYVLTTMKVQGKDKPYALGLMESYNQFSATLRNYYVQISRAVSRMTLVTDDKTRLLKALEFNEDAKKSALNYVSNRTLQTHVNPFSSHPKALDITTVVEKKSVNDEVLTQKKCLLNQYIDAKTDQKTAIAAKTAWNIINDASLRRMARLQSGFSESILKQDAMRFATLKLLKHLSPQEQEKVRTVKRYLEHCSQTQKAWQSIHQGNAGSLQTSNALEKSDLRNALAFKVAEHIEDYQPYLHHFSIGKLNRMGVSQYRIEKGEESALARLKKLSVHADKHQVALNVTQFFNEGSLEKKESLATCLKQQSKIIHPHLIRLSQKTKMPLDGLWKEINQHARRSEEKRFKETLGDHEKNTFETLKQYQSLNKELAIHVTSALYALETGKALPDVMSKTQAEIFALRNQIASVIQENPSAEKLLHFFNIDKAKLQQQAFKHDKRENVLRFKQATSNFHQKRAAALAIAADIKGHYPFIKELGANTKTLNTLIRIEARHDFIHELSPAQKDDFLQCMDYKILSRKASRIWKNIFSDKEQGKPLDEHQLFKAQALTAKRDRFAYALYKKSEMDSYFVREKLDPLKIEQQARQHKARLATLMQLNITKDTLLDQLERRAKSTDQKASLQWHKDWTAFNNNLQHIVKHERLYQEAVHEALQSPLSFTNDQKRYSSTMN